MGPFAQFALILGASFIGISIGHSLIRGLLGGGSQSHRPAQQQYQQAPQVPQPCQIEAQQLGQCIEFASKDISKCQIYMDNLKQCQQRSQGYQV
ncbi:unnamed protein product [Blepharisma stoltei]|uniref:CHCH domain-containing protein n=1 Tax=Blepharisma stoltei TaxID=1481888 RepID=A0AAU9IZJ5_9CILI|nr:unnamed protein product [Blepharisma stoltei]